jgi:hypothetical protein
MIQVVGIRRLNSRMVVLFLLALILSSTGSTFRRREDLILSFYSKQFPYLWVLLC